MVRRGNPDWGKPLPRIPALPTEFDLEVKRLGLTKAHYAGSAQLRRWCERNRNRVYVPEWLLKEWRLEVVATYGDVA